MSYMVYDEEGELMRVVGRQEEARQIAQAREGWTFKCVRKPKEKIDLTNFEEAPFEEANIYVDGSRGLH